MNIDEMSKGDSVELEVRCNGKSMNFQSQIFQIITNSILIASIKVDEQTIGFNDNCSINFFYITDGKLFAWENVTVKLVKYNDEVYHKIDFYGDGKPYNRRGAYRLYLGEDMDIYVNTLSGPTALNVLIKDISETGIGFITKEELDINRTFRLKFKDNNTIFPLSGIIVRKEELKHLDSNLYGCKFTEKNNELAKYITRKQSELLKSKSQLFSSSLNKIDRQANTIVVNKNDMITS